MHCAHVVQVPTVETKPTLLITREIEEHANVFHTMTDLLNVFISLRLLQWEDVSFQIVLLDSHPPGPLDLLWTKIATASGNLSFNPGA